jgi:tetratricopeptide (TPR) repeat protein
MPKPGLYSNLGIEYIRRGDTSTAIGLFQRALAFDSTFIVAHANLGIYLYGRKDYQRAAYHASKAIQLGFADPRLIKATGSMYEYLGQFRNAIDYYDRYLLIRPNDNGIRQLRDQLFARLNGKRAG